MRSLPWTAEQRAMVHGATEPHPLDAPALSPTAQEAWTWFLGLARRARKIPCAVRTDDETWRVAFAQAARDEACATPPTSSTARVELARVLLAWARDARMAKRGDVRERAAEYFVALWSGCERGCAFALEVLHTQAPGQYSQDDAAPGRRFSIARVSEGVVFDASSVLSMETALDALRARIARLSGDDYERTRTFAATLTEHDAPDSYWPYAIAYLFPREPWGEALARKLAARRPYDAWVPAMVGWLLCSNRDSHVAEALCAQGRAYPKTDSYTRYAWTLVATLGAGAAPALRALQARAGKAVARETFAAALALARSAGGTVQEA